MMALEIFSLRDKKEMADICASWCYAQWGSQNPSANLSQKIAHYKANAQSDGKTIPATWVAFAHGRPAGMASLENDDHPDLPDLKPWLASVYVHPFFRRSGVAAKLVQRVEREAREIFGFKRLYLFTGGARVLYEKQGWTFMRKVRDPLGHAPDGDDLMMKDLH